MMWNYNPTHDELPKGSHVTRLKKGPKGKEIWVTQFEPVKFLAVAKCGAITITNMLEDGRLLFYANGELPRAWMAIPEVESP